MMMFTNKELEMLKQIRSNYHIVNETLDAMIAKFEKLREKNRRDSRESQRKKRLTNRT